MTDSKDERKANRKERKGAKELLRIGNKAWLYRRDRLPPIEERALNIANQGLRESLQDKGCSVQELDKKARILDNALRKSGGNYYHKKNWVENVEMLLVAAIVILGIRSFFVQPFIIPTNSMYPSFYGMTPHTSTKMIIRPVFCNVPRTKFCLAHLTTGWKPNLAELYIWFCKMGRATSMPKAISPMVVFLSCQQWFENIPSKLEERTIPLKFLRSLIWTNY